MLISLGAFLSLGLMLCLCSCGGVGKTCSGHALGSLKLGIMSFNVRCGDADDGENRWEKRRGMVFDVIRDYRPDIVGLQEALRFQLDQIRAALPEYGELGVGRKDGKTEGEYSAILYRTDRFNVDESSTFWFSDTPNVPNSKNWGNKMTRICTWARLTDKKTSRSLYFYNLHLDNRSQPSRERSVELLTERIRDRKFPEPVILTGDFNAGEDNPAILYIKGKCTLPAADKSESTNPVSMVDTFRLVHPNATVVGTSGGFEGRRDGKKIDYIFVAPGTRVIRARIVYTHHYGRYPSDHFPITARILIPGLNK
jgi:endonuclease/exonuclease/phosphatase family metal-dependent hydrolase